MPRRRIDVDKQIKLALKKKPLVWSELEEKSGVSKGALSKHLTKLIEKKIILTKIQNSRPPITKYCLAEDEKIRIISYLTQNMPDEKVTFLVNNLLTEEVYSVLLQSFQKILENYSKLTLSLIHI